MEYLVGFVIALFIALTGVGAGTITVPTLILFLGVPAGPAVAIGLMFATAIKFVLLPTQIFKKTIVWKTLGYMLLGGVPGVLLGSIFLKQLVNAGSQTFVNALLGFILVLTATWQLLFSFRKMKADTAKPDRSPLLAGLMFPVGAEVGFSSAGAGALGSAALLSLTPLLPAQVVGTDIAFGFVVSLIGSGIHWSAGGTNAQLLTHLIAGGVFGAIGGTLLSTSIPRKPLRLALWIWLLLLGSQFLFNSYQAWAAPRYVHAATTKPAGAR